MPVTQSTVHTHKFAFGKLKREQYSEYPYVLSPELAYEELTGTQLPHVENLGKHYDRAVRRDEALPDDATDLSDEQAERAWMNMIHHFQSIMKEHGDNPDVDTDTTDEKLDAAYSVARYFGWMEY